MFDYKAKTEDELELKKGDVVKILNKVWAHFFIFYQLFYAVTLMTD